MNIQVNGNNLYVHYIKNFEDRPTIIFLHDSLGCTALWRDFPGKLCEAAKCNMLVYDRTGYGMSGPLPDHHRTNKYLEEEADILHHLTEQLSIEKPLLFGHSDGASIALIAAGKYPAKFGAVIAEAGHVFVEQVTRNGIKTAVKQYHTTTLKTRLEKYHGDKTDPLFMAWTQTWLSEHFRAWNIEHFLPLIECPVLVIQGENDEYGTIRQVEAIAGQVKGKVETYIVPAAKHSPHKEIPEEILYKSTRFISSL